MKTSIRVWTGISKLLATVVLFMASVPALAAPLTDEVCYDIANLLYTVAIIRDNGASAEQVVAAVEELPPEDIAFLKQAVIVVYNEPGLSHNPYEIAHDFLADCVVKVREELTL